MVANKGFWAERRSAAVLKHAVLSTYPQVVAFTFLDPFGTALAHEVLTGKLLARPRDCKTEVLLNLSLEAVWRIGGHLSGDEIDPSKEAALERGDRFLGGPWWRHHFREARQLAELRGEAASAAEAARAVAAEFQSRIHEKTGFHSLSVEVRRDPGHAPIFLLVLFYRWPGAAWLFNDAVSTAQERQRQARRAKQLEDELARLGEDDGLFADVGISEDMQAAERSRRDKEWRAEDRDNRQQW